MAKDVRFSERAVLVTLGLGRWEPKKKAKKVQRDIETQRQTAPDTFSVYKNLLAKTAVEKINAVYNSWHTYHYDHTLPWTDAGKRLLPAEDVDDYTAQTRSYAATFEAAYTELYDNYDALKAQAKTDLNGEYVEAEYPELESLKKRFYWKMTFDPVPDAGDFRVNLQAEAIAETAARYTRAQAAAMKDVWQRLYDVVKEAAAAFSDPKAVFRDTKVDNIRELVALLPRLNIAADPELEALRVEVESKLAGLDPERLRKEPWARTQAAKSADELTKRLEGFI